MNLPEKQYQRELQTVLDKECLCIGLSNAAANKYEQPFLKNLTAVTICPGPNIIYFSKSVSLQEMSNHIYGRSDLITDKNRPHVFINELFIYVAYFKQQLLEETKPLDKKKEKYFSGFYNQLLSGINYYRQIIQPDNGFSDEDIEDFNHHLNKAEFELEAMPETSPTTAEYR